MSLPEGIHESSRGSVEEQAPGCLGCLAMSVSAVWAVSPCLCLAERALGHICAPRLTLVFPIYARLPDVTGVLAHDFLPHVTALLAHDRLPHVLMSRHCSHMLPFLT